jgi:CheY-like chemotaxis protein
MMASILVVDDELASRVLLRSILTRAGHVVLLAEDGQEALTVLENYPDIDLIMTDLQMPYVDGYQLLETIQQRTIKKMVISAHVRSDTNRRVASLGCESVIRKPCEPPLITEEVARILQV